MRARLGEALVEVVEVRARLGEALVEVAQVVEVLAHLRGALVVEALKWRFTSAAFPPTGARGLTRKSHSRSWSPCSGAFAPYIMCPPWSQAWCLGCLQIGCVSLFCCVVWLVRRWHGFATHVRVHYSSGSLGYAMCDVLDGTSESLLAAVGGTIVVPVGKLGGK